MSRLSSLSSAAKAALFAQEADNTFITLVTFTGTGISPPVRIADNYTQRISETDTEVTYGVISRSNNYLFLPFNLTLPIEDSDQIPQCQIRINDVTRFLIPTIRNLTTTMTATIELVLKTSPNTVEVSFPNFLVGGIQYNADAIIATLTVASLVNEPFPAHTFTPSYFPGLF